MSTQDLDYYRRRERQEREHAARAEDNAARRLHLEMAERYSAMLAAAPAAIPLQKAS
jgi:hypothetical protein